MDPDHETHQKSTKKSLPANGCFVNFALFVIKNYGTASFENPNTLPP
jgi:hypothetical protein